MLDGGVDQADGVAFVPCEALAPDGPGPATIPDAADPGADWRDDLRLFGFAWAAGFVFFTVMLA